MKTRRAFAFGGSIGLLVGIVMVVLGFWVPTNSTLFDIFYVIHWPMLHLVVWIQHAYHSTHGWGPSTDFGKWLMAYLSYWTFLGFLASVVWRASIGRKHAGYAP